MDTKTLGERLREARRAREMTQDALATRIGVSRSLISLWESGSVQEIPAAKLRQAARAVGVTLDFLLEGDDIEEDPADYSGEIEQLVSAWHLLTSQQQETFLARIRRMAEHNRRLLEELRRKAR